MSGRSGTLVTMVTMHVNTTTSYPFTESQPADFTIGTLYLFCLMFGVPGNILAFSYFIYQNKDLSTCLYLCITALDVALCAVSSIIGLNFFNNRDALLFHHGWFCAGWRMVFKSLQRLSVYLVLILSISRATVLVIPLHHVHKRSVLGAIAVYVLYLITENIVLERHENIIYDRVDVYCYEEDNPRLLSNINDSLHVASLALPLVPIVISCVLSVMHVRSSTHISAHSDVAASVMKRRATVTVILFTLIYLVFNIPLIVNLIIWIITVNHYGGWPGPVYSANTFLHMYFWNITDVLFVGLNAAVNPLVYFLRFPNCQRWTRSKLARLVLWRRRDVRSTRKSSLARDCSVILPQYSLKPYSDITAYTETSTPYSTINRRKVRGVHSNGMGLSPSSAIKKQTKRLEGEVIPGEQQRTVVEGVTLETPTGSNVSMEEANSSVYSNRSVV